MAIYAGARTARGIVVEYLDETGRRHPLPHLVRHSPTGFEWGYGGSGPADLARSLVGHLLGCSDPDPAVYQEVKWDVVAKLPWAEWHLDATELRAAIARAQRRIDIIEDIED